MGSGKIDQAIGILNGIIGDYLDRSGNELATQMCLVVNGAIVRLTADGMRKAFGASDGRLVLLVHGVAATENIFKFQNGDDYGSLLERDLGYRALYLRYNSGKSIADNGALLSALLAQLTQTFPVPIREILLLGYSMGGLVIRAACHVASTEHALWLKYVRRAVYVGTPHQGAPLERIGRVVNRVLGSINDPVTQLVGQIANLRSTGIKDLGDAGHPVPLLPQIDHYLVAGSLSNDRLLSTFFGDSLVPVPSATNGGAFPSSHVRVVTGVDHIALAHHTAVYECIRAWCQESL